MIKLFFTSCIIAISLISYSQVNLVPNYSFENIISCPTGTAQFYLAEPWFEICSPELYNSCADSLTSGVNVPQASYGFQYANTGVGFAGIAVYTSFYPWKEYMEVMLLDSLKQGKRYSCSFYVTPADNSVYVVSKLSAYFSLDSITGPICDYLNYQPQVSSVNGVFLNDTINWTIVTDTFISSGGEQYLTIGNFQDNSTMSVIAINDSSSGGYAYYYIDDVSVYELPSDTDTIVPPITICDFTIPTLLHADMNSLNISNLQPNTQLKIFNGLGQLIFLSKDYQNDWQPPAGGLFIYDIECPNGVIRRGKLMAIR